MKTNTKQLERISLKRRFKTQSENQSKIILFFAALFTILFLNQSCITAVEQIKKARANFSGPNLTIYKYMGLSSLGNEINEKSFWSMGWGEGEFMIRISSAISIADVKNNVKNMPSTEEFMGTYKFAFVEKDDDTIYASQNLKNWAIVRGKNRAYFSIEDQPISKKDSSFINKMRQAEPILNECKMLN
ncbi:hypothetical protein [Flavobacterium sp.]|uniref:hypothetical protein n=1 Tax=Flavobacterium sp. TaxID=239 RepID=UPI002603E56F|nr:hypothetical protein [Flavobacterium sp.]